MLSLRKRRLEAIQAEAARSDGGFAPLWRALAATEKGAIVTLGIIVVVMLLAPWLVPYNPIVPTGTPFEKPFSPGHLLGTDNLGMDMLTRVIMGARSSLVAALIVTTVTAVFGTVIGVLAGFKGGWLDTILMRITDLFLAFPATIIAMAVAASLGPSMTSSMIGISVVWWPLYARLVRGEVRRILVLPHVEAARMSGTKGVRLLTRHVLPAVTPTIAVTASLDIGGVILTLASLSFVGLGTPAPAPELGRMASEGMRYVLNAWWVAVFPGLIVGFLAFVFNYVGDALRVMLRSRGV